MFIPIGENLNAGWENVKIAIENRDSGYIGETARRAVRGGAAALNLGGACGPGGELENLVWLIETAAGAAEFIPALDSADPEVLEEAVKAYTDITGRRAPGREPAAGELPWLIVNSISGERERYARVAPLVREHRAGVIALAMDDSGVPGDADARVRAASDLVGRLRGDGIPDNRIFVDALTAPVGVNTGNGPAMIDAVRRIRIKFPGVHITCGLSNVSAGMPDRELLSRAFLPMLIAAGLDCAIMDTADPVMMKIVYAARALAGADPNCAEYLAAYRKRTANVQA